MIDKRFVESFLRLNNISTTASTAEIRTILTQAHWPPEQIKEALLLYTTDGTIAQALSKRQPSQMFRPDMDWSSSNLSSLLGTDVIVDPQAFHASVVQKVQFADMGKKMLIGLSIALIAVAIAASTGIGLMYFFEVGLFHKDVSSII